jgi:RNA polymerase sigma-70 factor (ECF subfamily)
MSDEELLQRVRAGDTALFEVLMRRYNQRLYRVVRSIMGNSIEIEDAIQQAYVNAFFHLHQFAERARFATWLTKIAVHEALARARRRSVADGNESIDPASMDAHPSALPDPEHQAFAGELRHMLEAALEALPESYRVVFMLREVEGLSTIDTAECLEINEDTVKTRLHRARGLLRDELYARAGAATAEAFQFHAPRCDLVVARVMQQIAEVPASLPAPSAPVT